MGLFDDLAGDVFGATPVYDGGGNFQGFQGDMLGRGQDIGGSLLSNAFGSGATVGTPTVADIERGREQMGQPGISRSFLQKAGSFLPGFDFRTETDRISGAQRDVGGFSLPGLAGDILGMAATSLAMPSLAAQIGGAGAQFHPLAAAGLRGAGSFGGGSLAEHFFPDSEKEFYSKETDLGAQGAPPGSFGPDPYGLAPVQQAAAIQTAVQPAMGPPDPFTGAQDPYGLAQAMQDSPSPAALNQFDLEYQRQGFAPLEDQRVGRQQLLQSYRDNMPPPERQVLPPITATPPRVPDPGGIGRQVNLPLSGVLRVMGPQGGGPPPASRYLATGEQVYDPSIPTTPIAALRSYPSTSNIDAIESAGGQTLPQLDEHALRVLKTEPPALFYKDPPFPTTPPPEIPATMAAIAAQQASVGALPPPEIAQRGGPGERVYPEVPGSAQEAFPVAPSDTLTPEDRSLSPVSNQGNTGVQDMTSLQAARDAYFEVLENKGESAAVKSPAYEAYRAEVKRVKEKHGGWPEFLDAYKNSGGNLATVGRF